MALVSEVLSMGTQILNILSKLEDYKEDWFHLSKECKDEVDILRSKLKYIEEQSQIQRLPTDSTIMKNLEKAKSILLRAEARISRLEKNANSDGCCGVGWQWYARISLTLFPEKFEKLMKKVGEEIGRIPQGLKEEGEFAAQVQAAARRQSIRTTLVDSDNLYVSILQSEKAVMTALENQDGLPIILLHGGLGKGKSTLARYICYHYGKNGEGRTLFEEVIFVSCGNCSLSNLPTKQLGILGRFSPTSLADSSAGEKIGSKTRIAKAFEDYLSQKKKKNLIILDNLEDEDFLYHMWKASGGNRNVKYLVTSRKGNLCLSLTTYSTRIRMEDPNKDEARKILASLIGLKNKEDVPEIPSELQAIADEMIDKTEGNPLALACLASNFAYSQDRTPKERKRAWLEALENYCNLLESGEAKTVLGYEDYDEDEESKKERKKRSLWAAMKGCLDSLDSKDATTILFLMYSCKGASVPEEVIRTFYGHLRTSGGTSGDTFSKSIDELSMRELLKRSTGTLAAETDRLYSSDEIKFDGDPLESSSWSLRPLVKLYMQQYMAGSKELKATIDLLIDYNAMTSNSSGDLSEKRQTETEVLASEKASSVTVLCALYFDRGHQDPSVSSVANKAVAKFNLSDIDDTISDLQRKAIEPMIWLMDQPQEPRVWMKSDADRARKVLLKYIGDRQLDQDSILHLLSLDKCPSAPLVTFGAMASMFYIEEIPLLKDKNLSFLDGVLRLVDSREGVQSSIQKEASRTLLFLSRNKGISHELASTTGVLDVLVRSLQDSFRATPNPHYNWVARNAAVTLGNLAIDYCEREDICLSSQLVTNKEGAIASLVKSLSMHHYTPLRTAAAFALRALMWREDRTIKDKIVNEDGAIPGLVECLFNNEESALQQAAATAFQSLFNGENGSLNLKIANEDGVVPGLVHCLSNNKSPGGQQGAVLALGNLAGGKDHSYIVTKIITEDRALTGLLNCCSENADNPKLQVAATYALKRVLWGGDDSIKSTIVSVEGLLPGLVRLLVSGSKSDVQKEAAWAFGNLLSGKDDSLKLKIANEDGVIRGLVQCLSNDKSPDGQQQAAFALGNLACGESHSYIVTKIISEDGALTGLLKCCSENDDNPILQQTATYALKRFLSGGDDSIRSTIVSVDGFLPGLVRLLLESDDKPGVQNEAAWAFLNLLSGKDDSLQLKIANEDGVIRGLLHCLSNKVVQRSAAEAIINIGQAPDVKAILRQTDGVLQGLSSLLADDVPADTQDLGARALTFIDPAVGKQATLHTGRAYKGRAYAYVWMAMFVEALADFDEALDLQEPVLSERCFVKAKLEDFTGALDDANKSVKNERTAFSLQERGILKRMMGNLEGALKDLDEGLKLETDDYERLKHRGYVKFLLKDEEGAQTDAEWALRIKPPYVDLHNYGNDPYLGTTPVEYLSYILK